MATVAEIQKRKKKLQEKDPEEFKRQMEAQAIAEQTVPEQFSQAQLDEALSRGINPFKGRNLQRISNAEQEGQKQRNIAEAAVAETSKGLTPTQPLDQSNVLFNEAVADTAGKGQAALQTRLAGIAVREAIPPAIQTAAEVINGITSVIASKKAARVQFAETGLNDAIGTLSKNIDLVRTGAKPNYSALRDFDLARESMNELQRTNKGIGKANLAYWLGGGKATDIAVIQAQTTLENLRIELLNAIAQGAVSQQALAIKQEKLGGMS